jgi:hypothetical protein
MARQSAKTTSSDSARVRLLRRLGRLTGARDIRAAARFAALPT